MQYIVIAGFLLAALINLAPVSGVIGAAQLERAYGVSVQSSDMALLLRHRAVLFGIVGGLLAVAAFVPSLRLTAFVAGMVSMVSFLVIRVLEGETNAALARVAMVDYVGIAALTVGGVAAYLQSD